MGLSLRACSSRSATIGMCMSSCRSGPRPEGWPPGLRRPPARPMTPPGGMLSSISIRDLRSYATLDAGFGPGPQLIVGPNAAGKTTLVEAIVLLAWGRSHRTSTDAELVRWGSELTRIEGISGPETIEVALVRPAGGASARKRIRVNGVARRAAGLVGLMRTVVFAPEEMLLVIGSP